MKQLIDSVYTLTEGAAWLNVKGFSIRIQSTDEGVVVDVYGSEGDAQDPIASTYAFDTETAGE